MNTQLVKRIALSTLLVGLAAGAVAYAATFAEADTNGDGKLSLEEAKAAICRCRDQF